MQSARGNNIKKNIKIPTDRDFTDMPTNKGKHPVKASVAEGSKRPGVGRGIAMGVAGRGGGVAVGMAERGVAAGEASQLCRQHDPGTCSAQAPASWSRKPDPWSESPLGLQACVARPCT